MALTDRTGIYREDGGKWRVRIHSDSTDSEQMRTVELECLHEFRPSPLHGSIAFGAKWISSVKTGWERAVGWTLTEEN